MPFLQVKKRRNPAKGQCSNAPVLASLPIDLKLCASNTSSRLFICSTSRLALVVIYIFVNFVHISLCSRRSWTKKRRSKRLKGVRHMMWTSPLPRRLLHRHARQFRRRAHHAGAHVAPVMSSLSQFCTLVICYHCYNTYDHSPCSCLSYGRGGSAADANNTNLRRTSLLEERKRRRGQE